MATPRISCLLQIAVLSISANVSSAAAITSRLVAAQLVKDLPAQTRSLNSEL
uniref:Uncharacterized protein n=1 Tax=Arundo donax TaxID=35708 RepID=A0A0A9SFY8_ARUDO